MDSSFGDILKRTHAYLLGQFYLLSVTYVYQAIVLPERLTRSKQAAISIRQQANEQTNRMRQT